MRFQILFRVTAAAIASSTLAGGLAGAGAEPMPRIIVLPSAGIPPQPQQATIYALNQRLPLGRGLAAALLEIGVSSDDAGLAARLAAGHLGDGAGGCEAKIEISRGASSEGVTLHRIVLTTAAGRTVIERRAGSLTLATEEVQPVKARIA